MDLWILFTRLVRIKSHHITASRVASQPTPFSGRAAPPSAFVCIPEPPSLLGRVRRPPSPPPLWPPAPEASVCPSGCHASDHTAASCAAGSRACGSGRLAIHTSSPPSTAREGRRRSEGQPGSAARGRAGPVPSRTPPCHPAAAHDACRDACRDPTAPLCLRPASSSWFGPFPPSGPPHWIPRRRPPPPADARRSSSRRACGPRRPPPRAPCARPTASAPSRARSSAATGRWATTWPARRRRQGSGSGGGAQARRLTEPTRGLMRSTARPMHRAALWLAAHGARPSWRLARRRAAGLARLEQPGLVSVQRGHAAAARARVPQLGAAVA
jgi:hypothetical protein